MNTLKVLSAFCLLAPTLAQALTFNQIQCEVRNEGGVVFGSLNIRLFGPRIARLYNGHLCSPATVPAMYRTEYTETSLTLRLKGGEKTFTAAHHPFTAFTGCTEFTDTLTTPVEAQLSLPLEGNQTAVVTTDLSFTKNLMQGAEHFIPRRVSLVDDETHEAINLSINRCVYSN